MRATNINNNIKLHIMKIPHTKQSRHVKHGDFFLLEDFDNPADAIVQRLIAEIERDDITMQQLL